MLGGPSLGNRGALAMASAIRHPSLAMLIANANDADRKVSVAIILYVLVGLILGSVYRPWIKRRLRNEARGRILYGPATHSLR
jgi:BASS family bile acid:Na+ symporter